MRQLACWLLLLFTLRGAAACRRAVSEGLESPTDSLFDAGLALYGDEKFDSAHAVWTTALMQARASGDGREQARLLTELGLAEWRLTRLAAARSTQESAIALKVQLALTAELSRSYNALGLLANSEGKNQEALRFFTQAVASARAAGDSVAEVKAVGNQALPAAYMGDFVTARAAARRLRTAGQSMGDARLEGNGLNNEAMVDIFIGDPRSAIARLDTARRLYDRIVYRTGEQTALGQLASAWELTGDYDRSFAALDTALVLVRSLGLREEEAINLRLIARLHERVGDYRRAIRFYEQAATIFRETGAHSELGVTLRGEAGCYLELGNMDHARESATEAARMHREAGEEQEELGDLILLAELSFRSAGINAARPHLDSMRVLADRIGTRGAHIDAALGHARLADLAGNSDAVLDALARVAPEIAPGDYGAESEAAALEARALARTGRLEPAVAAGRRSVAAVERIRNVLPSEALRSTLVADRAQAYGDLVLILLSLGRSADAFAVADQARSRGLIDHLAAVRGDTAGALPRQLAAGEDLLRRIDQLVQRLRETDRRPPHQRGPGSDLADADLTSQLVAARNEYEAMFVRTVRQDPRASALLGATTPSVETVQASLSPTQALLEYLITIDRVVIFVITREGVHVAQGDLDRATLSARVRLLRDLWGSSRSDWRSGLPASRALHRTLVLPVLTAGWLHGITDLVVVPHGILGQLPFAALQSDRTGRFLVQDFSVTHLPSAGALATLGERQNATETAFTNGMGFAPFPVELPASGPEVAAFRTHFTGTITRLGPEATESAVRLALERPGPVHVATHGILNARNPMFSRIELARSAAAASIDDGRLEVHEILGLTIRSPLVFFSGCETGAGLEWTADPVLGTADLTLSQAVLAAGARQVVSTLWRIDDAGAAEFAEQFYQRVASVSVAEAFAQAQRTLAGGGRFNNPYYWAGYILSGGGTTASERSAAKTSSPRDVALLSQLPFQRK